MAAALAGEADGFDAHAAVNGLAHVVYGECGDADGGEGFHLDAGLAGGLCLGGDADGASVRVQVEIDGDAAEGQRVAEGYEVGGLLGAHDARDAGYGEDVALVEGVVGDEVKGFGLHCNAADCYGDALGVGLGADINHAGVAALVYVGESALGHGFTLGLASMNRMGRMLSPPS